MDIEYLTAREMTRQRLSSIHLDRGNSDFSEGREVEALAEFRTALNLDPQNEYAQQRVLDAVGPLPLRTIGPAELIESADTLNITPVDALRDFHYSGDSRGLLTTIAASYGLTVVFDDSFPPSRYALTWIKLILRLPFAPRLLSPRVSSCPLKIPYCSPRRRTPTIIGSLIAWACASFMSRTATPPKACRN